jgi:hypothetical protein
MLMYRVTIRSHHRSIVIQILAFFIKWLRMSNFDLLDAVLRQIILAITVVLSNYVPR